MESIAKQWMQLDLRRQELAVLLKDVRGKLKVLEDEMYAMLLDSEFKRTIVGGLAVSLEPIGVKPRHTMVVKNLEQTLAATGKLSAEEIFHICGSGTTDSGSGATARYKLKMKSILV